MKLSLFRSMRRAVRPRASVVLVALLCTLSLSAVTASSASAFGWWIGTQAHPEELKAGSKLSLGSESKVKSPFTLKWLHGYEVSCGAVKYDELYIEGPVFLGAHKITFEECTAKKPKGAIVVGGKIETSRLTGEIKPNGSKVEFDLKPDKGLFASFALERSISPKVKHKHKRKGVLSRHCKIDVSVAGQAGGTLGDATKISTEKDFEFDSKALEISQVKRCHKVHVGDAARRASRARPALTKEEEEKEEEARELKEQEEEEALEREEEEEEALEKEEEEELEALEEKKEKTLTEAEECRNNEGGSKECKTLEKEAKEIEEVEAERKAEKEKELEEVKKEEAARGEEEELKPIEGNKGKTGYNGGVGWGV